MEDLDDTINNINIQISEHIKQYPKVYKNVTIGKFNSVIVRDMNKQEMEEFDNNQNNIINAT